ncbi:hypothetical protein WUBG_11160 [Wuchereria bancrofti]|uniref:Serpin domain-containing protein n=1 Tax=Wuchereria bancrofti TaxID=6293 RepID=J9E701_WUCBA|nr:hypothetical protein WUBG_11160 [Wuchereria bancrofti]
MINQTITAALLLFASFQFVLIFGEISSTDTAQFDFAVSLIKRNSAGRSINVFILPKARFGLSNVLAKLTGEDLFKYINDTKRSSVTVSDSSNCN